MLTTRLETYDLWLTNPPLRHFVWRSQLEVCSSYTNVQLENKIGKLLALPRPPLIMPVNNARKKCRLPFYIQPIVNVLGALEPLELNSVRRLSPSHTPTLQVICLTPWHPHKHFYTLGNAQVPLSRGTGIGRCQPFYSWQLRLQLAPHVPLNQAGVGQDFVGEAIGWARQAFLWAMTGKGFTN